MQYKGIVFAVLILTATFSFMGCRTAPRGSATTAAPQSATDFLRSSDTPQASSREEILDFSNFGADPYYIGPGDVLKLKSGNNEFPEEELKVSPDSKINVVNLGEVSTLKKELKTLEQEINQKLKVYYLNVECKLTLVTALNRKISLLGAVKSPGIIPLDSDMTLIDVIARAGGFDADTSAGSSMAKTKYLCRIIRDNGKTVWIDLKEILFQNASANNIRLKNNDILYVYKQ